MGRQAFLIALGIAGLAAGGAFYYYHAESSSPPGQIAQAAVPVSEKVVAVEAEAVTIDTVLENIRAVGTLGPDEAVVIAPEIAGRIDSIHFGEGDEVKAGDVLVELDATTLRDELDKARPDMRSEERRVGQECVSTCRSRWAPET